MPQFEGPIPIQESGKSEKPPRRKPKESPAVDIGPTCDGCVYWVENKDEGSIGRCGDCRRYPPTVLLDSKDAMICVFPYTESTDSCGEFKQKVQ